MACGRQSRALLAGPGWSGWSRFGPARHHPAFLPQVNGLSQTQLGSILGYDKTYISALELGKRTLDGVASRRRVCQLLRLPPHVLGITDAADSDHQALSAHGALAQRLPHQLHRIMRIAADRLPGVRAAASDAIDRLREQLAA